MSSHTSLRSSDGLPDFLDSPFLLTPRIESCDDSHWIPVNHRQQRPSGSFGRASAANIALNVHKVFLMLEEPEADRGEL